MISLVSKDRRTTNEEPKIEVESNIPFELIIVYDGKEKSISIKSGKHNY